MTLAPGFYNMDCMEGMAQFPDKFFELAIVDPPYGINIASMNMGAGKGARCSNIRNRKWMPKQWDNSPPDIEYFNELMRVSANQIVWGGNYFDLGPCKHYVIWDKEIPDGLSFADCEMAWTSIERAPRMFRYSAYNDKADKFHPTQKPIALYKWLLSNYAKPGDKILDTHVGSASSLIACHQMGYEYWGFELDTDYYKAATERLNRAKAQVDIFEAAELPKPEQVGIEEGK